MIRWTPRTERRRRQESLLEALEPRVLLSYTFSSVASFTTKTSGAQPQGLVMDAGGDLFGVTAFGGTKNYGTVFKIAAGTGTITTLATFNGTNGMLPRGQLVLDASGNLFGVTVGGGAYDKGTIFELAAGTASTITTLASFNGVNGSYPVAGLTVDASGNLFGTSMGANLKGYASTVFELATGSSTITALATFKYSDQLAGTLVINSSGDIFGTTELGGAHADGSIFKISGTGNTVTTLASFAGSNGSAPIGNLLLDSAGNLLGETSAGGSANDGTLFKLPATASSTIVTVTTFTGTNGQRPVGTLIQDSAGNLFGVTAVGGAKGVGSVFELPATSSTVTTLYSFVNNSNSPINPTGALVMDANGSLWGATDLGGNSTNAGTIFKLLNNNVVFAPPPAPAALPVAPAPVLRLVIAQQPASVRSGTKFTLVVKIVDAGGKVVKSAGGGVTLSISSGPAGGVLAGTLSVRVVNGVASLSGLMLKGKGVYTLRADGDLLAGVTGGAIKVT